MISNSKINRLLWLPVLLCPFVGCGGDDGPPRYGLSGSVTYDGQSVPRGYIVFTPDDSRDNHGPGTQAEIVDGNFATPPQRGTIGGPHVAVVTGFDGQAYQDGPITNPNGKLLFSERKVHIELPRENGTYDFNISPAQ